MAPSFSKLEPPSAAALRLIASIVLSLLVKETLSQADCEVLIRAIPILAPVPPETSCCSHSSITCNGTRIIEIMDIEEILQGFLPEDINLLDQLEKLFLINSGLKTEIPENITLLPKLRELVFEFTDVEGSLPSTLGRLTSLTEIRTYGNYMKGNIPESICDLPNIQFIYFGMSLQVFIYFKDITSSQDKFPRVLEI
jgi:hypothetical protein